MRKAMFQNSQELEIRVGAIGERSVAYFGGIVIVLQFAGYDHGIPQLYLVNIVELCTVHSFAAVCDKERFAIGDAECGIAVRSTYRLVNAIDNTYDVVCFRGCGFVFKGAADRFCFAYRYLPHFWLGATFEILKSIVESRIGAGHYAGAAGGLIRTVVVGNICAN